MHISTQFLKLLALLLIAMIFTQCKSAVNTNINGGRPAVLPGGSGRIEGDDIPDYLVFKSDVAYLQTLAPPKIRIVFPAASVDLPAAADDVIKAHWKEAISYYYNDYFNKPHDASELVDRETEWSKYCRETDKKLQNISINAPDGSRYIADDEARDIHAFVNQIAKSVINRAKSVALDQANTNR